MPSHLYISPHIDDAVYSCGGLIYQQTSAGDKVEIVTVCAGDPPEGFRSPFAYELETRWGEAENAIAVRRDEDFVACERVGAKPIQLNIPDAIYRRGPDGQPLYASEEALVGPVHPSEEALIERVGSLLREACSGSSIIYAPIGYGGHVDHRLVRKAVETLGKGMIYFRDMPYAARGGEIPAEFPPIMGEETIIPLNPSEIEVWGDAIANYSSQISTFWADVRAIHNEISEIHDHWGGIPLIETRSYTQLQ
ncbi:MAG: hypothetical protein GTO18_21655 [Anaerolineales bacterium]|nr:hypothetical protein [Anaerolineales bacterium]